MMENIEVMNSMSKEQIKSMSIDELRTKFIELQNIAITGNKLNIMMKERINKLEVKEKIQNKLYQDLKKDFDSYKNGKDINYLDRLHHKQLVDKSVGQIIDKPEECWFDAVEVKVIRNDILYGINIEKDFITLKEISDEHPEMCMTVIAESPLSGAIYRYNNYGDKKWQLIGTMIGYC